MNAPSEPRCALSRLMPVQSTSEAELFVMRRRAWHEQGVAILAVSSIDDPWLRQAITNEANRFYSPTNSRITR